MPNTSNRPDVKVRPQPMSKAAPESPYPRMVHSKLAERGGEMGFWHTGYMEFHEQSGEMSVPEARPEPPVFPCPQCGLLFMSERDFRVHILEGHVTARPLLVFKGRECGRSRLTVTTTTDPTDWIIRNAEAVVVNGRAFGMEAASTFLATQRSGVSEVDLTNAGVSQSFAFEFALAEEEDLQAVERALDRLIEGGELSHRSIDDFIMRGKQHPTARRYLDGIASYLYGVLAREGSAESDLTTRTGEAGYQGRYDSAVGILGEFDRHPAEAICGIVAFHHNQFSRAATKTKSQRVAEVTLRIRAILDGQVWASDDISLSPHPSLDHALSDTVIEQVLSWCAVPLDGSAADEVAEMVSALRLQRPSDAFKLRLIAAEHYLAVGDLRSARRQADDLRHGRLAEDWYAGFSSRAQGATRK